VAFALQASGWYLRSDIVWHKPNPMPESVTDRPTKSHEYIFLMAKSERYYFDQEAVREAQSEGTIERFGNGGAQRKAGKAYDVGRHHRLASELLAGRNIRSVWTITPEPFSGAHFATFPQALVERCLRAGTSEEGACPQCGAPWERVTEASGGTIGRSWHDHSDDLIEGQRAENAAKGGNGYQRTHLGWRPTCTHPGAPGPPVPCTVLDPFAGAGTVGLVCQELGRHFIGIELKPEYVTMSKRRIRAEARPMFGPTVED
jgi:DNA modification methylase